KYRSQPRKETLRATLPDLSAKFSQKDEARPFFTTTRRLPESVLWSMVLPVSYRIGATISHSQPARKQRPPSGVIGPSQRRLVSAITYKLPLKRKMPAKSSHHAPRLAAPKSASTNNAIA